MVAMGKDTIPLGRYEAQIIGSRSVRAAPDDYIEMDFKLIGGSHDGKVIVKCLHVHSPVASMRQIARHELSRICLATGVLAPKDSVALHNIPMFIYVDRRGQENTICDYTRKPKPLGSDTIMTAPPAEPDAPGPCIVHLSDVQPESVRWLWPDRIATGKLTLIAGDPGLGKSFLTLDIAARVTTGAGWPDTPGRQFEPGDVVLLSAEDDIADTIRPRLDSAGANVARVVAIEAVRAPDKHGELTTRPVDLSLDVRHVEAAMDRVSNPKLVVVDPISAYMGETDSHNNAETRAMLARLADLASRRGVAVVCVSHLNKGSGRSAVYRVTGSLGFVAAARTVWSVSRDELDRERRLMLPIKNNLAKDTTGLAYSLHIVEGCTTPCIAWEDETIAMIADDVLNAGDHGESKTATEEAADWLRQLLATGPIKPAEVIAQARDAGYSESTVQRAKRRAGVESIAQRDGDNKVIGWAWQLRQPDNQPTI